MCFAAPGCRAASRPVATRADDVGVGPAVTDRAGRLLLVQEAVGPARGRWKLPTGLCEADEDSDRHRGGAGGPGGDRARRFTKEVLAVRHSHGFHRGRQRRVLLRAV